MELTTSKSLFMTVAGVLVALIAWVLVYIIAHVALSLLDELRGLSNSWLQEIFREWFTPGVGGYTAMHVVNKYIEGASLKWVSIFFGFPLVVFFIGFPLYIIAFHSTEFVFSWKEQIMQWGMAIASCIGSFIAYRSIEGNA